MKHYYLIEEESNFVVDVLICWNTGITISNEHLRLWFPSNIWVLFLCGDWDLRRSQKSAERYNSTHFAVLVRQINDFNTVAKNLGMDQDRISNLDKGRISCSKDEKRNLTKVYGKKQILSLSWGAQ